ncbi:MAG: hypothetical protein JSW04_03395 [Desulfobacterales bacterium]|nr:MAG: hypothetical protein JSW04_03395 [Desulfobacterales bacterium]
MVSGNIKEQIDTLVNLQKIEMETINIKSTLNNVSKKIGTLDNELKEFEQKIEDKEAMIVEMKKNYRDRESDFQMNLDREKKIQVKLRSVKTNKEYQSLLKEIEDVRVRNSKVEDEMIECLDNMDEAEKEVVSKKDEYLHVSARIISEKKDIMKAAEQGKERLAELENDWESVSGKIDSGLLKTYDLIKERNKGRLAVVPVKDAVCHGCNVNLPPQLYNELYRGDTLKFCPNCQRIIYWEGS